MRSQVRWDMYTQVQGHGMVCACRILHSEAIYLCGDSEQDDQGEHFI